MGTSLSQDLGVVLIINVIGTVLALAVLIWTLGPTSGAHFNPAVTLVAAFRREVNPGEAVGYVCAQVVGALVGVGLANLMYSHAWWEVSSNTRSGAGLLLGEVIATAGLLWVIGMLTGPDAATSGRCSCRRGSPPRSCSPPRRRSPIPQ